ncbi:MAG: hypothetical protein AAFR98_07070 [Pseudomonadota bacterium]
MVEFSRARRFFAQISYVALSGLVILISLVPIDTFIGRAFPLTLFAITFATMLRSPKIVPLGAVALVFLFRDILYFQPIGLEAFLVVAIIYVVRNARRGLGETLGKEWGGFAVAVCTLAILKVILTMALMLPPPSLGVMAVSVLATIIIYPLVTAALAFQFGLRKPIMA